MVCLAYPTAELKEYICDWIWENPSSTHTSDTTRYNFHHHTIAVYILANISGRYQCWKLPKLQLLLLWLVSESCRKSSSAGVIHHISPLDNQPAIYKSPHDWLVSLAMDLAILCDMWSANDTSGCRLVIFSEDLAFACHFVAPWPPPPPTL